MKKHILIELVLVIAVLSLSFWNVTQQEETVSLRGAVTTLSKDKKGLKDKGENLKNENERLSDQAASSSESLKKLQKEYANTGTNVNLNSEYNDVVTKLFEANLNFTPENYEQRKEQVSNYLSEDLKKEYFGKNRKTYQDMNGTSSKLKSLEVYPKGLQNKEIEGVVIAYYASKQEGQEWTKGMTIFKVHYNFNSKKVMDIVNLGNGYSISYRQSFLTREK